MRRLPLSAAVAVLAAAKLTTNIATRFVYAFLPAIARGLGVSVGAVGWLASARWGVGALTPAMVRIAGREHRRTVLVAGLGLFAAGALVTAAFGVFAGALAGFVLMGLGKPMFDTGAQAVVADRVPYARRARTIGVLETTWALGFLLGAPLAGWLIQELGWQAPFWALGGAAVALVVPVAMAAGDTGRHHARGALQLDGRARAFLVTAVCIAASAETIFITFATWLEEQHGFGLASLAALATGIGMAELAAEGMTILTTDRLGKARAVAGGMLLAAAGFGLTAVAGGAVAVAIGGLVAGIAGFEFAIVSSISLATELVPQARIQYLSRMVVAQALGRAAAAVVGLALYAAAGMAAVGVTAAAVAVAAAFVVSTRVRDHEEASQIRTGGGG